MTQARWELTSIDDGAATLTYGVDFTQRASVEFGNNDAAEIDDGVNLESADYTVRSDQVTFDGFSTTLVAPVKAAPTVDAFTNVLDDGMTWTVDPSGDLMLSRAGWVLRLHQR